MSTQNLPQKLDKLTFDHLRALRVGENVLYSFKRNKALFNAKSLVSYYNGREGRDANVVVTYVSDVSDISIYLSKNRLEEKGGAK